MEVRTNCNQYAEYKEKQTELAKMMDEAASFVADLNMQQQSKILESLSAKVHNETFKIQVVGTFKNGKSTFINSFLGEDVLPAYSLPCTAIINEVKWGAEKKAVIHFRNPLPEKMPASIPSLSVSHMEKYGYKNVPPLEIPYDAIYDYAVIPFGADPTEMMLESPYAKIELFWPLPLLENGIEIIDSPGLNEHATRTKVTMEYLSKADAILFVLNAQALCSQEEMRFIENNLKTQGFNDPFFVVNRFDIIAEREREMMKRFAEQKLKGYSTNEIFYVSGLQSLEAKLEGDAEKYEKSGMKAFEEKLSAFLTREKGKAKLSQPSRELKRIINDEALFKVIPNLRSLLESSLDAVREQYDKIRPKLESLKLRRAELYNKILYKIEQCKPELKSALSRNYMSLINSVPAWIDEAKTTVKISFVPKKQEIEAVFNEISGIVLGKIEEQQLAWKTSVFEPFVAEKVNDIFGAIDADINEFYKALDAINIDMTGKGVDVKTKTAGERFGAALSCLVLLNPGAAIEGGVSGFSKDMVKSIAINFGAMALLDAVAMLNPITGIIMLAANVVFTGLKSESKAISQAKDKLRDEFINQLSEKSESGIEAAMGDIDTSFVAMANQIVSTIDAEISDTEAQITGIIEEMEKGKENIRQRTLVIDQSEARAKEVSQRLDSLIFSLMD